MGDVSTTVKMSSNTKSHLLKAL